MHLGNLTLSKMYFMVKRSYDAMQVVSFEKKTKKTRTFSFLIFKRVLCSVSDYQQSNFQDIDALMSIHDIYIDMLLKP